MLPNYNTGKWSFRLPAITVKTLATHALLHLVLSAQTRAITPCPTCTHTRYCILSYLHKHALLHRVLSAQTRAITPCPICTHTRAITQSAPIIPSYMSTCAWVAMLRDTFTRITRVSVFRYLSARVIYTCQRQYLHTYLHTLTITRVSVYR